MKPFLFFVCIFLIHSTQAQDNGSYLHLQNDVNGKTRRLNLERASYLYISIDSAGDSFESNHTYTSYNPVDCVFGRDQVIFKFSAYSSYNSYSDKNDSYYYREDFNDLMIDSTIRLKYLNENTSVDLYLTYQTKFRRVMYSFGVGLFCASLFNAVLVAPMIGMNNGSFQNYNWNRLWKYELYSGLGLAVSIPISVLFLEKQYHFQTTSSYFPTWRVVDGE